LYSNGGYFPALTPEQDLALRIYFDLNAPCLIPRESPKTFFDAGDSKKFEEDVARYVPMEHAVEHLYHRPIKELSLREIVDGLVINLRVSPRRLDTVHCSDDGDYYTLKATHSMGPNCSRITHQLCDSLFGRYGAKTEGTIRKRSIS
jgi:hypothetical protein